MRGFRAPLACLLVGLATLAVEAGPEITGTYELATSDGKKGFLYVQADLTVRRRLFFPDKTIHSQVGKGTLEGSALKVTFTGTGDPRDLTGDWSIAGEDSEGRFKGTAHLAQADGRFSATFHVTDVDAKAQRQVELAGTLEGTKLHAERDGVPVDYTLSPDGFVLSMKQGTATETWKRSLLPANGGPTAAYVFSGNKVSGQIGDLTETGTRVKVQKLPLAPKELLALPVEPDPVPSGLKVVKDTSVLAQPGGATTKALKAGELVPVCGKQDDYWIVGPFKDGNKKWKGFLKNDDLNPSLHYAKVDAPLFLVGKRPTPNSILQKDLATCYFDAALMAIAAHQPGTIEAMLRDLGDGTVAVRFHVKDEHGHFAEHWVRVKKTIIVDEQGRSHYTGGEGGQLWPALAEKAWAAWHGKGYYRNIEYGSTTDVFEVLLGRPAKVANWLLLLPGEMTDSKLRTDLAALSITDRQALVTFGKSASWQRESASLVNHPSRRRDIAYVDSLLSRVPGLSPRGHDLVHSFYASQCEGPLGSGNYSKAAKDLHALIVSSLKAQRPLCLATKAWGQGGTGQSGGENMEVVPGLASSHEYMVLEAYWNEKNGHRLAWIKVVNPWHHFSRFYEWKGDQLVASARDGRNDPNHGTFAVELSDLMRYYAALSYVPD
ncbi:MAG TPA: C2 family cysteine protease [Planctomycetota bacterium]|nr:C2 family cysteine protease [Planctomycetota bacterium]